MQFFITRDFKGGTVRKNVLLGSTIPLAGKELKVNSVAILKEEKVRSLVADTLNYKICKVPEWEVPIVTIEDEDLEDDANDVTSVGNQLISFVNGDGSLTEELKVGEYTKFDEKVDWCKKLIRKKFGGLLGENCDFLVDSIFAFYLFVNFKKLETLDGIPLTAIDSDFFQETKAYLDSLKKVVIVGENKTLFQKAYNDEFFVRLPSWYDLTNDSIDNAGDLVPNLLTEVAKPYLEKKAYTPQWREVPNLAEKLVVGQSKNNGKGVTPYNERYYNSLVGWVKQNIENYYGDSGDGEVIDPYSQEYLLELLYRLYSLHWSHNINVPCSIEIAQLDEEVQEVQVDSKFTFYAGGDSINAIFVLRDFIKSAVTEVGWIAYIDAVIQVSRWGLDKPTYIVLDGYDSVFDLGTNRIRRKDADLSKCEIKKRNGAESWVKYIIYCDKEIVEELPEYSLAHKKQNAVGERKLTLPVGLTLATDYVEKGKDEVVYTKLQHYSMLDFVKLVSDVTFVRKIAGIEVVGDRILVTKKESKNVTIDYLLEELKEDNIGSYNPFYRSRELEDLMIKMDFKLENELPDSILTILNEKMGSPTLSSDLLTIDFTTKEELLKKKSSFVIVGSIRNAIATQVFKEIFPVFAAVEKNWENGYADDSEYLESVFTAYKKAVKEVEFSTEVEFYNGEKEENSTEGSSLGSMDLFSIEGSSVNPLARGILDRSDTKTRFLVTKANKCPGILIVAKEGYFFLTLKEFSSHFPGQQSKIEKKKMLLMEVVEKLGDKLKFVGKDGENFIRSLQ